MPHVKLSSAAMEVLIWIRDTPHSRVNYTSTHVCFSGMGTHRTTQVHVWNEAKPYAYMPDRIHERFMYPNAEGMKILDAADKGKHKHQSELEL